MTCFDQFHSIGFSAAKIYMENTAHKTPQKPGKISHFRNLVTVAEISNISQNIHRWMSEKSGKC